MVCGSSGAERAIHARSCTPTGARGHRSRMSSATYLIGMIGTAGIVTTDPRKLASLNALDGRESDGGEMLRHMAEWCGVLARDGTRTPAIHTAGGVTTIVVGDIYEAGVSSDSAEYIRKIFDRDGVRACTLRNGSYAFVIVDA